jgi:hypothetical protein
MLHPEIIDFRVDNSQLRVVRAPLFTGYAETPCYEAWDKKDTSMLIVQFM